MAVWRLYPKELDAFCAALDDPTPVGRFYRSLKALNALRRAIGPAQPFWPPTETPRTIVWPPRNDLRPAPMTQPPQPLSPLWKKHPHA